MAKRKETIQRDYTVLPNSVEAEKNLLCCIMRNTAMQMEIVESLEPSDFYQPNHAIIFQAMKSISKGRHKQGDEYVQDTINFTTLVDSLRRSDNLGKVGDIDYILHLNDMLPGTANFDEYLAIVKRASTMRKLIDVCERVKDKAYRYDSEEDALGYAETQIFGLSQRGKNEGLVDLSDVTAQTMVKISNRYTNPEQFKGLPTGFKQFDRLTNGLHGGELIVLAARPGVGKSALAMNIVENVAKQGKTVAVFSLEMSNEQLIERMLSGMSTVPLEYIKSGQFPNRDADLDKLRMAQEVMSAKMRIFGNDFASIRPSEIASQCRRQKASGGLDLVVIDYIQLMMSDTKRSYMGSSRQEEVANITRSLKLMAKELNVPVIALSQLKRDAEIRNIKGEKGGSSEPVLSDLRESGAIEQDADIVLFIHKDTNATSGEVSYSLVVAKHRNGETASIPLRWWGKIVRFVDDDYIGGSAQSVAVPVKQQDVIEDDDGVITITSEDIDESLEAPPIEDDEE